MLFILLCTVCTIIFSTEPISGKRKISDRQQSTYIFCVSLHYCLFIDFQLVQEEFSLDFLNREFLLCFFHFLTLTSAHRNPIVIYWQGISVDRWQGISVLGVYMFLLVRLVCLAFWYYSKIWRKEAISINQYHTAETILQWLIAGFRLFFCCWGVLQKKKIHNPACLEFLFDSISNKGLYEFQYFNKIIQTTLTIIPRYTQCREEGLFQHYFHLFSLHHQPASSFCTYPDN